MDRKDYNQIGKDIRDAVQNAVNSMDFSELNRQITQSVNDALNEIQGAFDSVSGEFTKTSARGMQADRGRTSDTYSTNQTSKSAQSGSTAQSEEEIRRQAREKLRQMEEEIRTRKAAQTSQSGGRTGSTYHSAPKSGSGYVPVRTSTNQLIAKRPKGSVSHVVRTVFGSIMLGGSAVTTLVLGTITLAGNLALAAMATVMGLVVVPVGTGGAWLVVRGAKDRARVERFRTYVSCLRDRRHVKISDLAAAVKKKEAFVCKDLTKMIQMKMFPQGHINGDQTMFLLDDATYAEFETRRQELERRSQFLRDETREQRQLRETIERGQQYIQAIRKANDDIPGEEISEKLYRLETSVGRIYAQIQKAPYKLPELRKFQEYYLPTTLKLVETYREFDGQPIAGDNIKKAKAEIEASLETIILAFDKLFDSLFAETAMDVATDISVLQTLLAQEGLTQDGLGKYAEKEQTIVDETADSEQEDLPDIRLMF